MEVILLESIEGLGTRGDRVQVARGYARNFLLPRQLALQATGAGARVFEEAERAHRKRTASERTTAESLASKMSEASMTLYAQVGEDEKLFGSVTAQDIAEALTEQGYPIDRRQVLLEEPIKVLGVYWVEVKLFQDIHAKVKVWVAKQESE